MPILKSTDPVKAAFVAAAKKHAGVSRITNCKVSARGVLSGDLLERIPEAELRQGRIGFRRVGRISASGDGSAAYPFSFVILRPPGWVGQ